ncbi:MAG: Fic family protein [Sphaerochaeta sp.]
MNEYIWQNDKWPNFYWNEKEIATLENEVFYKEGFLKGLLSTFEDDYLKKHQAQTITNEIERSWKIESENLDQISVYSSVCRKMNIEEQVKRQPTSHIDGIVDITLDALNNTDELTESRLLGWHSKMFPTSTSGGHKILRGQFRKSPVDVVKGEYGKEVVVFSAINFNEIDTEMQMFFKWINKKQDFSKFTKSAIAHLWFATIHPFEDGNGRLARAISDFVLYQSSKNNYSFYSISSELKIEQRSYYEELNRVQTSDSLDITDWLKWYLKCLNNTIEKTTAIINNTVIKEKYMRRAKSLKLNARQSKMLNKITGNWTGKITTAKWSNICSCSQDTSNRDINDLIKKGLMKKIFNGPHTHYEIVY